MVLVTRRLPKGCETPHATTHTLNYNNLSVHSNTFVQPSLWPNSSFARAREVKKQKQKAKKTKEKQARRRSNLGHRAYPTRYYVNFHMVTVTRRL
jgi:hypothetical protein